MPAPETPASLLNSVQSSTVSVAKLKIPPPWRPAVLPERTQPPPIATIPTLSMPPPSLPAELPDKVPPLNVTVPPTIFSIPPPLDVATLSSRLQPVSETVAVTRSPGT